MKSGFVAGFLTGLVAGGAIGTFVSIQIIGKKAKNQIEIEHERADEEIRSVIKTFENRSNKNKDEISFLTNANKDLYDELTRQLEYNKPIDDIVRYNEDTPNTTKNKEKNSNPVINYAVEDQIEIIPPSELGATGYNVYSYTYYSDGVLCDENDNPITDYFKSIGPYTLRRFGEYEDDSVCARNHLLKIDFEILESAKTYREVEAKANNYFSIPDDDFDDDE